MSVASNYFNVFIFIIKMSIIENKYIFNKFSFRFGVVERVIIYKEKQSDSVDDDSDTIVKIFVEFTQMSGNLLNLIMS